MIISKNQRGDTIVEVLIAVAVTSVILAGAYVTSNHSLKDVRQAQEQTEALKYAESQLEQLQAASSNPATTNIFSAGLASPTTFYMTTSSTNAVVGSTTTGLYTIKDIYTSTVAGQYVYTARVTWESVLANGTDQITLTYKIDQ